MLIVSIIYLFMLIIAIKFFLFMLIIVTFWFCALKSIILFLLRGKKEIFKKEWRLVFNLSLFPSRIMIETALGNRDRRF